jgi:hypothetical protein
MAEGIRIARHHGPAGDWGGPKSVAEHFTHEIVRVDDYL